MAADAVSSARRLGVRVIEVDGLIMRRAWPPSSASTGRRSSIPCDRRPDSAGQTDAIACDPRVCYESVDEDHSIDFDI
ncbi:MAG TPA: hypothetical protein VIA06_10445 [Candidatus Dormibacteraeota bacterium]|nr:hypothetical protein [Candidatus Dormibacteraeota bacterium]